MPVAGAACRNWWRACCLPIFAFAESNWSAVFFFFAVAGLVSIGAMGASGAGEPVRSRITPGE